jgi:hypothetical protein
MNSQQKRMFIGGVGQVLLGCFIGCIPPPAVQHYRSIVTAHIEFTANGVLLCVLGLLMPNLNLGRGGKRFLEIMAYLGTVLNGSAFIVTAFTGFGTSLGHTTHQTFPFPKGIEGPIPNLVTGMLLGCGVTIIAALVTALVGLIAQKPNDSTPSQSDKIK